MCRAPASSHGRGVVENKHLIPNHASPLFVCTYYFPDLWPLFGGDIVLHDSITYLQGECSCRRTDSVRPFNVGRVFLYNDPSARMHESTGLTPDEQSMFAEF